MGIRARHAAVWAGFALAVLLQLVVLYLPSAPEGPGIPGTDKAVHAAIFLLPALLGTLAGIPALALAGVLAAHAVLSEAVQHLVLPDRSGDVWDVVADITGILIGSAIAWALLRRRARRGGAPSSAA
ncbi:VanZ family protein [Agromyces sp. G08B096]|uniref:VanZ family protein n=1 Tax=Agromyces sp. G08B096 TaxID=3156399 RepID=A0AAU7W8R0_9MICO